MSKNMKIICIIIGILLFIAVVLVAINYAYEQNNGVTLVEEVMMMSSDEIQNLAGPYVENGPVEEEITKNAFGKYSYHGILYNTFDEAKKDYDNWNMGICRINASGEYSYNGKTYDNYELAKQAYDEDNTNNSSESDTSIDYQDPATKPVQITGAAEGWYYNGKIYETEEEANEAYEENGPFYNDLITGDMSEGESTYQDEDPLRIMQLERYLRDAGYGYSQENLEEINDLLVNKEEQLEADKNNEETILDKFFSLCTEDEKPEYAEEPTKPDDPPEEGVKLVAGEYMYNGNRYNSESEAEAARKADLDQHEKDMAQYEKDLEKYEKWALYEGRRTAWYEELKLKGYLEARDVTENEGDVTADDYRDFWLKVAQKSLGLNVGTSAHLVNVLAETLYETMIDENGEPRNLFQEKVLNNEGNNSSGSGSSGSGSSGSGSSGSGSSGGGSSGGGSSGSGSSGGDSTGGGSSGSGSSGSGSSGSGSSGSGSSGGDSSEEDLEPAAVEGIEITSPSSGAYKAGQEVKLKVTFNKNIYGSNTKVQVTKESAPKLYLKFSESSSSKEATFNNVSGKNIIYSYQIQADDNGTLGLGDGENFKGTVYNESGVETVLTSISNLNGDTQITVDNGAPSVQSIEVTSDKKEYQVGDEIEITVTFDEDVYSNSGKVSMVSATAPVLNISFGEGEVKHPTLKSVEGNKIIYTYTVTSEDRGVLKIDAENAFDGSKEVYDATKNGVKLTVGTEISNTVTANENLSVIQLDTEELTIDLKEDGEAQLTATTDPSNIELTWKSSNENIATVNSEGKITAKAIGETTITVTAEDGMTANCVVYVKDTTNGETIITLDKTQISLDLSEEKTANITATITPSSMKYSFVSANTKIAKVDENGVITAIGEGSTTITVKAEDGTKATCKVTVQNTDPNNVEETELSLSPVYSVIDINRTKEMELKTIITPSNADMELTYESSDENIATVDSEGKVTINSEGTVVIIARSEDGQEAYAQIEILSDIDDTIIIIFGDGNQDGSVDVTDIAMIQRGISYNKDTENIGTKHQDWVIEGTPYLSLDVNGDGIIDITDESKITAHIAATKNEEVKEKHPDWIIE